MTYGEIVNAIRSFNRNYEREQKEKALFVYKMADLVAAGIGSAFSKEAKFPQIYDAFPRIFEKEKALMEKAEQEKATSIYKAKFIDFTNSHNARWGEQNSDT